MLSIERFAIKRGNDGKTCTYWGMGKSEGLYMVELKVYWPEKHGFWPFRHALYICFVHWGRECIWKSKWSRCGSDNQGETRWPLYTWFWTCSCITEHSSFLNCIADQDKNHRRVWYYLWMQLLLVFCLTVMISPVSCLLDVLRFIPSLSGGNLFKDWVATLASLWNKSNCWVYSEMLLWSSMKNQPGYCD